MKRIKSIILLLCLVSLFSCSKKEGCQDINSLNYDSSAEKDGVCRYTKAIFYAPSNQVSGNGNDVTNIELFEGPDPNQKLIGTITTFNHPEPINCSVPVGSVSYELPSAGIEYVFSTRYYYNNGTSEAGTTYLLQADRTKGCESYRLTL